MALTIEHGDIHLLDIRTRMPFKYGIATMTESPQAFIRLHVKVDATATQGVAADGLPPKWFTKDPNKPFDIETEEMLRVIEHALEFSKGLRAATPFEAWRRLYDAQSLWGQSEKLPPLLVHLGTSLVERALIDGFCRALGQTFVSALKANLFGIDVGAIHPPLEGKSLTEVTSRPPLTRITVRHTIGLLDALGDEDIEPAERLNDGLPQSLEACTRVYGLRHFKVKICGNLDRDRQRLLRIATILGEAAPADFAFSLDGNEQFRDVATLRSYWDALQQATDLQAFFQRLLFVEQPLHRDVALDPTAGDLKRGWPDRPPVIIDESDGELNSLPRALALGYSGTSHKNCKGIFKSIANACLLAPLIRGAPGRYLQSGEDLANIGPIALLQDLTVAASLGIASVERNGHHYYSGLSMFPASVHRQMMQAHDDLYRASSVGWPTLDIQEGSVRLDSILAAPFGFAPHLDVEQFTTLAEWRRKHTLEKRT